MSVPLSQSGGGSSSSPFLTGDGESFPLSARFNTAANINLASASANAGYLVKIHVPVAINFTLATTVQPSGVTAGMNVYYGIYDLSGNLLTTIKFTTVNPGGVAVTLVGTITGALSISPGGYYWLIATDTVAVGTLLGVDTNSSFLSIRNLNGFGCASKAGVLSAGALQTPITLSGFTKFTTGQMGSNAIGIVFLEP